MLPKENRLHWYLLAAIIIIHILGLFIDIMDVDAAQYASISMEMLDSNQWLQVHHRHYNYLDKPPLLFWLSALSFKVFGLHNFAYKLPSFLFALLGIFSTYKLGKLFYGARAGRIAAITIASIQALFSITMDVRTDTILLGANIFAVWLLIRFLRYGKARDFIWGFIGVGLSMLAKGPIGLIVPAIAIGSDLIWKREWAKIFQWKWLLGLGIILIVLLPMMIGLYYQYDANPTAKVNGRLGVSGLYFYFWEQSFGRITGANVWKNDSGALFFVHTTLWAFLPWTIFLIVSLFKKGKQLLKNILGQKEGRPLIEIVTFAGFILPFIMLSMSHYKLPHYIFILFPFGAIMTGALLDELQDKMSKILYYAQLVFLGLLWSAVLLLLFYVFPNPPIITIILTLTGVLFTIVLLLKSPRNKGIIFATIMAAIGGNIVISTHFYPNLLTYQSTTTIGKWLKSNPEKINDFCSIKIHLHAVDYYSQHIVRRKNSIDKLSPKDIYLYVDEKGINNLKKSNIAYDIIETYDHFAVTRLSLTFLNPKTRAKVVGKRYLVKRL